VLKTAILVVILLGTAAYTWAQAVEGSTTVTYGLLIAGSIGGLWVLWRYYQRQLIAADERSGALADADQTPPRPRLQNTPARDFEDFRLEQAAKLSAYRWIDRDRGVVQIPIDRAMEIALEKGVGSPSREKTDQPEKEESRP
jgi:hypothetical protein